MTKTLITAIAIATLTGFASPDDASARMRGCSGRGPAQQDGTPAEETVCDTVGRRLFGLCNAYCEASDCDGENPLASPRACDRLRRRYEDRAGEAPPCDSATCNAACDAVRIECETDGGECEECEFVFAACLVDMGCQPPPSDTCDDDTASDTPTDPNDGSDTPDDPADTGGPTGGDDVVAGSNPNVLPDLFP